MAKDKGAADAIVGGRDWSETLYLPKTDFPMKAGLPSLEPLLLKRWAEMGLYERLREAGAGKPRFVLHDGPPYANGNIHFGHALNKILKDLVVKSQTMLGFESNYVPGWDCHGLPIEWKVEEEYRAKGKAKPDFTDAKAVNAFRAECRAFAAKWVEIQREEFKRLGIVGDWEHPYKTMDFAAEAAIAAELMAFAKNGTLYRGSKPVMWSVVEKTALAEAEVEYENYESDTIWVKFPVVLPGHAPGIPLHQRKIVIWTTTPWTIPGNRAIGFNSKISYGVYHVDSAPPLNWLQYGEYLILADKLAVDVMRAAKVEGYQRLHDVSAAELAAAVCAHPLRGQGYDFDVPLLDGDHVTDDTGTGFVHTAPGHGTDDYAIWMANQAALNARGIDTTIPFTVDADGVLTEAAPGFAGKRVLTETGDKPKREESANNAVIEALSQANALIARGRIKHQYPHSWRSKKPVIFRNTPQWFVAMDKPFPLGPSQNEREGEEQPPVGRNSAAYCADSTPPAQYVALLRPTTAADPLPAGGNMTLRETALDAIKATEWVPASGQNRITAMVSARPDWVLSRQRAWGVPLTVFRHDATGQLAPGPVFARSAELMARITDAFAEKGADVWFEINARDKFLGGLVPATDLPHWQKVTDILDVWFDSGCTHAFTLGDPAHFPGLKGISRKMDGGQDRVMYLEGSDQHRGWFQSSLLESCGTRGRAPYDIVLTHGFVLDDKGLKMSKSVGNTVSPQEVMAKSGADILRLWAAASDTSDDLRIGPEILKTFVETYRKLRNTLRWMLGALGHFDDSQRVSDLSQFPLERYMLHRLAALGEEINRAYETYEYRRVVAALTHFMNTDLSAFYFDIRKDALYCDAPASQRRLAALTVIEAVLRATTLWLAPILSFTAEEAWMSRLGEGAHSVHLERFPEIKPAWRDAALAATWEQIRRVRSVVTGALEIERAAKRIGSSLEAAAEVHIDDPALLAAVKTADLAETCITSAITVHSGIGPPSAFRLAEVPGIAVLVKRAHGRRCARSWRYTDDVGADPRYPELSARDAMAVAAIDALRADKGSQPS